MKDNTQCPFSRRFLDNIKENYEKLSVNVLKEMKKDIDEELKKRDYVMHIKERTNLDICINNVLIARIYGSFKELHIYTSPKALQIHQEWIENGCNCSYILQHWEEGEYLIIDGILTRKDIKNGRIYNFETCESLVGCADDNVLRYAHNDKPIIY